MQSAAKSRQVLRTVVIVPEEMSKQAKRKSIFLKVLSFPVCNYLSVPFKLKKKCNKQENKLQEKKKQNSALKNKHDQKEKQRSLMVLVCYSETAGKSCRLFKATQNME